MLYMNLTVFYGRVEMLNEGTVFFKQLNQKPGFAHQKFDVFFGFFFRQNAMKTAISAERSYKW